MAGNITTHQGARMMDDARDALFIRLETATGPDQKLFFDCYIACFGELRPNPGIDRRWLKFVALVNAEGWTDAAMMLVPEGCFGDVRIGNGAIPAYAWLRLNNVDPGTGIIAGATSAIALCIASMKVRKDMEPTNG